MTRPTNLSRALTSKAISETVENYVDLLEKGIEPATLTFISAWVFFAIDEDYPSREAFLLRIESVLLPVILLMTIVASSGGLTETLVKALLTSQLMVLIGMIELEETTDDAGDRVYRLALVDRLFIVSWIPLIYYLLIKTPRSSTTLGVFP